MKFPGRLLALPLLLLSLTVSTSTSAQQTNAPAEQPALAETLHLPGISNGAKVNDFLYRGGQPNQEGLKALNKLGIDMVVDLRGERRSTMETERTRAKFLGMHLVNIEGNGWAPPEDEQVAQFFSLIQQQPRQRIFVHCWFGSDRTGVFIAVYRIAFDGWTPEQALREMYAFHFKGFWHPAMKTYVRDFPARLAHSPVLAAFRQSTNPKRRSLSTPISPAAFLSSLYSSY
jgi:tyrosine-protein phosphatase SIW14